MRIAFLSDIHANAEAMRVLPAVVTAADEVVCLGDCTGYYCQVNEALDIVRGLNVRGVLGNHDYFVLHGCPPGMNDAVRFGVEYARRVLSPDHRAWLASLPLVWGGAIGGRTMLLAHGSPWRPLEDYLYADNPAIHDLDRFAYDVVAFGQTHRALVRDDRAPLLLNPGSVGQSRDHPGVACALVLDTETLVVERIACPYDVGPVIALAERHGAGSWITKHLV